MPIVSSHWLQPSARTWSLAREYPVYVCTHTQSPYSHLCTHSQLSHIVYTLRHMHVHKVPHDITHTWKYTPATPHAPTAPTRTHRPSHTHSQSTHRHHAQVYTSTLPSSLCTATGLFTQVNTHTLNLVTAPCRYTGRTFTSLPGSLFRWRG